jgi:vacuolar-type H+-ATPase subunit C/Vma6
LRAYLAFEKDLRNIITAIRARKKGLPPFDHVLGEGDLVDFLSRSTAEDFGLLAEYPWIEELMASWEPLQTEDTIQKILWGTIDEMAAPMHFEFDVVLAYLLKLHILEQNLALSDEGGKEIIRQLEEL